MTLVAFDAKQFRRGNYISVQEGTNQGPRYRGFNTHLGVGVSIDEPKGFAQCYTDTNRILAKSFKIERNMPFFSSTQLKQILGFPKAISFADQLITYMQKQISSIHCSYVILPPSKIPAVNVSGLQSHAVKMPTNLFISNLGPMFSYLTAHSYLWMNGYKDTRDLELHIDAFRSKSTKAWNKITSAISPKVFARGDECNPFISCADIVAFLTDAKLYSQHLKLNTNDIKQAWQGYNFDVTVQFFDKNNLQYYSWKSEEIINPSPYMARPIIFLAIDNIELEGYDIYDDAEKDSSTDPRRFNRIIKNSPVYDAVSHLAFQKGGCLKLFSKSEDLALVRDGDIFVYVGTDSAKIGKTLQDGYDIQVHSGKEVRKMIEKIIN